MLAIIKKLPRYLAKTAALFAVFFVMGCLLSMFIKATPGECNLRPHTGNNTTLSLDSLAAPWSVDSGGPVRVNLAPDLDLTLFGSVAWSRENLTGNTDWEYTSKEDPDNIPHLKATGKIKLGQGRWTLVISSEQSIEVNLRQVQ